MGADQPVSGIAVSRRDRVLTGIVLSNGETEALATKAARGAGLDWGLAEEAGRTVRWLARAGIDGLHPLLEHLRTGERHGWEDCRPFNRRGIWQDRELLCPIILGAVLCDHAALPDGPKRTGPIAWPILLVPFLARLTEVEAVLGRVALGAGQRWDLDELVFARSATLAISAANGQRTEPPVALNALPRATDAAVVVGLERLALKTTVPASEASRAGAGGDD